MIFDDIQIRCDVLDLTWSYEFTPGHVSGPHVLRFQSNDGPGGGTTRHFQHINTMLEFVSREAILVDLTKARAKLLAMRADASALDAVLACLDDHATVG
jgi:hypothetical protein